jgi:hypothetical protein
MIHSKAELWLMFNPINGRLVSIKGSSAQCMAHNIDVNIPAASQFIFNGIERQI